MKSILKYTFLEFKKYLKLVPYTIFSGILIAFILLVVGIFYPQALYGENQLQKIKVYVVSEESQLITNLLTNVVSNMDSVKDNIAIEITDKETAEKNMKSGDGYAILNLPKNILSNILDGTNSPAKITLNQNLGGIEARVFKEISETANKMLSTAQASVYSVEKLCTTLNLKNKLSESNKYVNDFYLSNTFNRNKIFEINEVKMEKNVSLAEYYVISAIFIFITFVSIAYSYFFKNKPTSIEKLIHSYGQKYYSIYICQNIAFSLLISILGSILMILIGIISNKFNFLNFNINFLSCVLVIFFISLFIKMVAQIFGNNNLAFMTIFFIIILFICGELIPKIFLPTWTNYIAKFLPYTYWRNDIVNALKSGSFNIVISFAIGLISVFIGSVHYNFLAKKWR